MAGRVLVLKCSAVNAISDDVLQGRQRDPFTWCFVTSAVQMAIGPRQPQPGLLHHSDRGIQYASAEYQRQLRAAEMVCSMSRKGNGDDHAVVERVFRSLKEEGFTDQPPETRVDATLSVIDYLAMFYNSHRLHSTLGY